MSLQVFVPSRSRWDRSLTLEALDGHWPSYAVVVPAAQALRYRPLAARHSARLLACPVQGIAATRQWIGQQAKGNFLMLDDDLRFYCRESPSDWHLRKLNDGEIRAMLIDVNEHLLRYAHVAISAREGNNRLESP